MDKTPRKTITNDQRAALTDWLRTTADEMRLRDWVIHVDPDPPSDEHAWAETRIVESYHRATISVSGFLLDECSDAEIAQSLIHELLHIHHGDIIPAVKDAAESADPTVQAFIDKTLVRYIERMVEQLSVLLVGLVDYPPIKPLRRVE